MIAAMANFLDYDVYDLELTAVKNNSMLRKLMIETTSKSIIVIEDIDCCFDLTGKRKPTGGDDKNSDAKEDEKVKEAMANMDKEDIKVTLSGLLNFIDGLWSACGREHLIVFTTNYLERIWALNPLLHAVIEVNPDAPWQARRADRQRARLRRRGPLHGIPVLLKDNLGTRDRLNTTAGLPTLLGSVVRRDAGVVARLRAAGAVILGKASLSKWCNFRSVSGLAAQHGVSKGHVVLLLGSSPLGIPASGKFLFETYFTCIQMTDGTQASCQEELLSSSRLEGRKKVLPHFSRTAENATEEGDETPKTCPCRASRNQLHREEVPRRDLRLLLFCSSPFLFSVEVAECRGDATSGQCFTSSVCFIQLL
ncbi:hypothetical protein Taro_023167 [Colocasia esculenta]|uniref:Amidase domain-containing protein n=1 Tax=Colocasia esculenta TaxID=4460 RepID=A0A843UWM6_COLES|nr:hypothetical protein [Colocasia esculenta]